ncbi:MAG: hypothetical protein DRN57_02185 [Thermoplasmata archaeon]|nr:MAG: hypothetical protein DRN57_02185 [Thermoplasmata archaeon]
MPDEELDQDYREMVNRFSKQPGLNDLLELYGQYDIVVRRSNIYLRGTLRKVKNTANNESSY